MFNNIATNLLTKSFLCVTVHNRRSTSKVLSVAKALVFSLTALLGSSCEIINFAFLKLTLYIRLYYLILAKQNYIKFTIILKCTMLQLKSLIRIK